MAVQLKKLSRIFFAIFLLTQGFLLVQYPVKYEDSHAFYGLLALYALALVVWLMCLWLGILIDKLGVVWFLYTLALSVMVAVIFGKTVLAEKELMKETFFGPNVLKTTLCIAPAEMLLLLKSVTDEAEILTELYFTATLDLFDGIEMLEVLLEDAEHLKNASKSAPEGIKYTILGFSLVFLLSSCLELCQFKFNGTDDKRKRTFLTNTIFQMILNAGFLVLRLVLWLKYERNAAIFISKNVISLVLVFLRYMVEREYFE